jgi:hypothetical protein
MLLSLSQHKEGFTLCFALLGLYRSFKISLDPHNLTLSSITSPTKLKPWLNYLNPLVCSLMFSFWLGLVKSWCDVGFLLYSLLGFLQVFWFDLCLLNLYDYCYFFHQPNSWFGLVVKLSITRNHEIEVLEVQPTNNEPSFVTKSHLIKSLSKWPHMTRNMCANLFLCVCMCVCFFI